MKLMEIIVTFRPVTGHIPPSAAVVLAEEVGWHNEMFTAKREGCIWSWPVAGIHEIISRDVVAGTLNGT